MRQILRSDWSSDVCSSDLLDPTYRYGQATFHPRGMTADELTEGCFRARCEFNRYSSMLRRALDFRANARDFHHLGLFAAANLANRREIFRKQGQPLGDGGAEATGLGRDREFQTIAPPRTVAITPAFPPP